MKSHPCLFLASLLRPDMGNFESQLAQRERTVDLLTAQADLLHARVDETLDAYHQSVSLHIQRFLFVSCFHRYPFYRPNSSLTMLRSPTVSALSKSFSETYLERTSDGHSVVIATRTQIQRPECERSHATAICLYSAESAKPTIIHLAIASAAAQLRASRLCYVHRLSAAAR